MFSRARTLLHVRICLIPPFHHALRILFVSAIRVHRYRPGCTVSFVHEYPAV